MAEHIKVIDLFAGPGGLGEGFSALSTTDGNPFRIVVSVEKEASAHKTLTLRAFFRQFERGNAPDDYYSYIRGNITREELFKRWPAEAASAATETLGQPTALGADNERIDMEIMKALGRDPQPWVLIGGPPCQAYSLVGRARNRGVKGYVAGNDHRNFLYREYLRVLAQFQPAMFVMENVKGMLSAVVDGERIFDRVIDDLKEPDFGLCSRKGGVRYRIYSLAEEARTDLFDPAFEPEDFIIRAERFGIPQTRHRVILLGIREDIPLAGRPPTLQRCEHPNLKQLIGRLPSLRSGLSKEPDGPNEWLEAINVVSDEICRKLKKSSEMESVLRTLEAAQKTRRKPWADRGGRYVETRTNSDTNKNLPANYSDWFSDAKLSGTPNHESRGHIRADLARYLFISALAQSSNFLGHCSPKLYDFPEFLQPEHANRKSGHFSDRFRVQLPRGPGSTVTSHISKDGHYFIHYDLNQCRSLTVREAARIQTFPDNYFFDGSRTQQFTQVGNAVPPFLARQIAGLVFESLQSRDCRLNQ